MEVTQKSKMNDITLSWLESVDFQQAAILKGILKSNISDMGFSKNPFIISLIFTELMNEIECNDNE